MQHFKSIFEKIKTISKDGILPVQEGINNFKNPKLEIEALAKTRLVICKTCIYFKEEPIDFLKIEDKRIKQFSGMVCDLCFCALPYKSRQSIEICEKWQKE